MGHVSAIEFDFEKRNEAHVKLDKMMSTLISDDVGYTALGIDTKRDKWFTKARNVLMTNNFITQFSEPYVLSELVLVVDNCT